MSKLRIHSIASFIEKEDRVVDIGCDHAYLAILLIKKQICQSVIASDINENALNSAKKNIKKEHLEKDIPIVLSDGLENINQNQINTLVIAGMGTSTILHILEKIEKDKIKKIVLQSNNDLYCLRKKVKKMGYYLQNEKVIYEKGHYYVIGKYTKKKKRLKKCELYFGLYQKAYKDYYVYLQQEYKKINLKINYKHLKEKIMLLYKMRILKKYL